jgi:hypothetical protein
MSEEELLVRPWIINLTQFSFNERIDPHSFSISTE